MAIPAEATDTMVTSLGRIASHDILDSSGQKVTIMGETGSKGRTIVKGVFRFPITPLERLFKGVQLPPKLDDLFF